jgi:hypothetical protein
MKSGSKLLLCSGHCFAVTAQPLHRIWHPHEIIASDFRELHVLQGCLSDAFSPFRYSSFCSASGSLISTYTRSYGSRFFISLTGSFLVTVLSPWGCWNAHLSPFLQVPFRKNLQIYPLLLLPSIIISIILITPQVIIIIDVGLIWKSEEALIWLRRVHGERVGNSKRDYDIRL